MVLIFCSSVLLFYSLTNKSSSSTDGRKAILRSIAILADDSRGDEHGAPKSRSRRRARDALRVFSFDTQTRECENSGGHTLAIGEFDIVTNLVQKQFLSRGGLR